MKVPADNPNSYHDQDFYHVPDCLALLDLRLVVVAVAVDFPKDSGVGHGFDYHFEYFPNRFLRVQKSKIDLKSSKPCAKSSGVCS